MWDIRKLFNKFKRVAGLRQYSNTMRHYRNEQNLRFVFPLLIVDIVYILNKHYLKNMYYGKSILQDTSFHISLLFFVGIGILLYYLKKNQSKHEWHISTLINVLIVIQLIFSYPLGKGMENSVMSILPFYISVLWCFSLFNLRPIYALFLVGLIFLNMHLFYEGQEYQMLLTRSRYVLGSLLFISFAKYHNFLHTAHLYEELYHLSKTDELSGVQNRHALKGNHPKYLGKKLLIIMSDIDNFKSINDTYGHVCGDVIIRDYAHLLTRVFNEGDSYRFGGDEFLIISTYDEETFLHCLDLYVDEVKKMRIPHTDVAPHFSLGYVVGECKTLEDLQKLTIKADELLYEAKNKGKDKIIGEII